MIVDEVPKLYETDGGEIADKIIYVHYFAPLQNFDWFIFEYDEKTQTCFGFANLNNPDFAELGYFSLREFVEINKSYGFEMIEKDNSFEKGTVREVAKKYPVLNKLLGD